MVKLIEQNYEKNKAFFNKIEMQLRKNIGKDAPIDHVGSTAIPDMIGKNIIDILIGAKDSKKFKQLFNILCEMGYFPSNNRGEIYQFFASKEEETGDGDVHLHLVLEDTDRYNEFLILKNYLLENKAEAQAYANCKREIISDITNERKEYRSVKSEYVSKLLSRAKASQNKK